MPQTLKTILLLCFVFGIFACDSNKLYQSFKSLPESGWPQDMAMDFEVEIKDTVKPIDMHVLIRHTPSYPFQNLYMFLETEYPNGNLSTDSIQFLLFKENGKPLSDCAGDLCDAEFMFRHQVRFPQVGRYVFRLKHAMRIQGGVLPMVLDVGIRIENSQNTNS